MAGAKRRVTFRVLLGSTAFALGQVVATLIFAPIAILAMALPYRWRYYAVIQWTHVNVWWLGITCGLRHEVVGKENIPTKPTINLSKHQSAWETIA